MTEIRSIGCIYMWIITTIIIRTSSYLHYYLLSPLCRTLKIIHLKRTMTLGCTMLYYSVVTICGTYKVICLVEYFVLLH